VLGSSGRGLGNRVEILVGGAFPFAFKSKIKGGLVQPQHHTIAILIDSGASHSYINSNIVEIFHLQRSKHKKSWLAQLAIGAKRKINELVKYCLIDMNRINTKKYVNIIPLGSYDCLIGMDWLEKNHFVLDFYHKTITCLDEEG
jgi:predicted aspartyl protease